MVYDFGFKIAGQYYISTSESQNDYFVSCKLEVFIVDKETLKFHFAFVFKRSS